MIGDLGRVSLTSLILIVGEPSTPIIASQYILALHSEVMSSRVISD
jgi:hypothetical protein